ncbi:hypothetical protein GQ457_14G020680 [Hibiscus cannabinus]
MAMLLILIFLLPLPFFLFLLSKHGNLPPSPPALPLIGHLHMQLFDNSSPHIFLWKLSQKYGSLLYLRFGCKPTIVVSSAEMAKEVMKTRDLDFCGRPDNRASRRLSYNGLDLAFAPYDGYWREMRKLCVVNLFGRVQQFRPIREDEVGRLMEKICQLSADSKPVNISEATTCLSSTIICRVGFGKRYAEEGAERSRFHGLLSESQALLSIFASLTISLGWVGWIDSQGFTIDGGDFPFDLTADHIKAILMNVFLAGTETSAAAITWAMSFLMKHPNCLKTSQDEIATNSSIVTASRNTWKVQHRWYEIPAKSLVFVNAWAIGRDPGAWENPQEFRPERFIDSSIDYKGLHFELIPFGAGRRICPGMRMGVATVELALANLLYKFDWEMPAGMTEEDIDFDALPGVTAHKKTHLILVARKIGD